MRGWWVMMRSLRSSLTSLSLSKLRREGFSLSTSGRATDGLTDTCSRRRTGRCALEQGAEPWRDFRIPPRGEQAPKVKIVDDLTIRYSWDAPNPDFLPQVAAAQSLTMAMPAHYLKKFHNAYRAEAELKKLNE